MLNHHGDKAKSRDEQRRARGSWVIIAGVAVVALVSAILAVSPRMEPARWKSIRITALEALLTVYPFVGVTLAALGLVLFIAVVRMPRRSLLRGFCARAILLIAALGFGPTYASALCVSARTLLGALAGRRAPRK